MAQILGALACVRRHRGLLFRRLHGEGEGEGAPLSQGAVHLNLAAHTGDNALDNGHPQAGAQHRLGGEAGLPLVREKQLGQELLGHPNAGIRHHQAVFGVLVLLELLHRDLDMVALPGKFQGIGQQIVENLLQPERVSIDLCTVQLEGEGELLLLELCLGLEGGDTLAYRLRQIKLPVFQVEAGLFDAGDLQNIVDETEQLVGGHLNFFQIGLALLLTSPLGQLGSADNDVEGGAHVVAHLGEELLPGGLTLLGALQSVFHQL